jgi:hypothetical protein
MVMRFLSKQDLFYHVGPFKIRRYNHLGLKALNPNNEKKRQSNYE